VTRQIAKQLKKLIEVVGVEDMTGGEHIERELVLLKLRVDPGRRDVVRGYVARSGGSVLQPASDCFIVELLGSDAEINALMRELAVHAELLEVVRSGALGISRHPPASRDE
jgi:acetolactate synthase I/III small subunit